jgi:Bacteriophage CI repressor helix-turn-helix domain
MNFFDQASLRLKQHLGLTQDKDVAAALGISARAWAGRKDRDNFPTKELRLLAAQRPELGLDVDWIVTGTSAYLTTMTKQETSLVQLFRLLSEQDRELLHKSLLERTGFISMPSEEAQARWDTYEKWVQEMRAQWQAPSAAQAVNK